MAKGLRPAEGDVLEKDLLGILRPYFLQKVVVQKDPRVVAVNDRWSVRTKYQNMSIYQYGE